MKGKLDSKTSPWPVLAWERFARYPVTYGTAFKTLHNSAEWMEWPQMREMEMSPASASEPNQLWLSTGSFSETSAPQFNLVASDDL